MERIPQRVARDAQAVAASLLAVTVTAMGLQLLRVFVPSLLFYLREVAGMAPITLGMIALALLATAFLADPLYRVGGLRTGLLVTAGGMALVRAGEQLSRSAPLDLVLSAAGVAILLLYLPLALGAARLRGDRAAAHFPVALLAGVAVDTALHIASTTYDLSWQTDIVATIIVLALAATALVSLRQALAGLPTQAVDASWRGAAPLLAIGPWLLLQVVFFQAVAHFAATSGLALPWAAVAVTAGNILGLHTALYLSRRQTRPATILAGIALTILLLSSPVNAIGLVVAVLIGQPLSVFLLSGAMREREGEGQSGLIHTTVMYGAGILLFAALLFVYYAGYFLPLDFRGATVLPVIALLMTLAVAAARPDTPLPPPALPSVLTGLLSFLLALAPLVLWLAWSVPAPAPASPGDDTVRIMTYNIHHGFNVTGRLDLESVASVIEASGAEIVALQEVSRGSLHTGSVDAASWLAQRLQMEMTFGPTTEGYPWGNAVLSRYPFGTIRNVPLPPPDLTQTRAYIEADLDVEGKTLHLLATHLHHVTSEPGPRQQQAQTLLDAWNRSESTVLAGDLNATPGQPEIQLLAEAGLVNVTAQLAAGPVQTYSADAPRRQIDYIWISPDLEPVSFDVPRTVASDHLPLVSTVRLP